MFLTTLARLVGQTAWAGIRAAGEFESKICWVTWRVFSHVTRDSEDEISFDDLSNMFNLFQELLWKSDSLPAAIARNAAKIRRAERLGLSFRKQDDTWYYWYCWWCEELLNGMELFGNDWEPWGTMVVVSGLLSLVQYGTEWATCWCAVWGECPICACDFRVGAEPTVRHWGVRKAQLSIQNGCKRLAKKMVHYLFL